MSRGTRSADVLQAILVPSVFFVLCVVLALVSGLPASHLVSQIITRLGRNGFLVLSLIIPIVAGLGLNFAIVIGAMAGQAALIMITAWGVRGLPGVGLAFAVALPIALVLGWLVGLLFNRARGKEMITGIIAGFFANAIYQLVFLFSVGSLIPLSNPAMVLPGPPDAEGRTSPGVGLRNTIDLVDVQHALDEVGEVTVRLPRETIGPGPEGFTLVKIPFGVLAVIGVLCLLTVLLLRTKLGQEFRAMGQDAYVAEVHGIRVSRNRILATMISIVLAAWGQIIWLQNMGNMNTYNAHELVGQFAVAALLVSGASVRKATWWQAILGVVLFHSLFVVLPQAAARLFPNHAQLGEYLRSGVCYTVILISLVIYARQEQRRRRRARSNAP